MASRYPKHRSLCCPHCAAESFSGRAKIRVRFFRGAVCSTCGGQVFIPIIWWLLLALFMLLAGLASAIPEWSFIQRTPPRLICGGLALIVWYWYVPLRGNRVVA